MERGTARRLGVFVGVGAAIAAIAIAIVLVGGGSSNESSSPTTGGTAGGGGPPEQAKSCLPPFGPFKAGNWPPGCWRPYSDASPFNQPIPANPKVAANSGAIVQRVLSDFGPPADLEAGLADTPDDFQHPVYYSRGGDPAYKIHCFEPYGGKCEIEGLSVRIPRPARPAGGTDSHLAVVDQRDGWEYDLFEVPKKFPPPGGTLKIGWGGHVRSDGNGLGSDATAAQFGLLAGIIRAQEMQNDDINHALFVVFKCDSGKIVDPALGHGRECKVIHKSDKNAPPMGARLQLAMTDPQIEALSVPAWKKTILRAMAHYGMYFGDTGGSGFDVQFESGSTYTSFGAQDRMVSFAKTIPSIRSFKGVYIFELSKGVDWNRYLRVLDPCVARGTC